MESKDHMSFKLFYTSYYNRSFLFAKSYVHDDWAAEDIASESLIKLWEMAKSQQIDNPRFVLFTLLKRRALDYLKHESIKQKTLSTLSDLGKRELEIRISTLEASDPEKIFETDIQEIIASTLKLLPEQTRKIFEMNRFQNIEKAKIAEEFGITVKGVDYHLSKALKNLRKNLKDYFPIISFLFF